MPEPPENVEYHDMGTMESHIFSVLEVRLCSGRKAFLEKGASYLAKVCAEYFENAGNIELEKIESEIEIDNSVEEWIKEIEENVKANKRMHRADRREKENYNITNGTVITINPQLQELIKLAEPTALMYR